MNYQHPAVHPLPPSLLSSEREEDSKQRQRTRPGGTYDGIGGRRRDLSSYILGEEGPESSMHHRVRLPGVGCMGGLGALMPPARPENKLRNNKRAGGGGVAVALGDRDKGRGGGGSARRRRRRPSRRRYRPSCNRGDAIGRWRSDRRTNRRGRGSGLSRGRFTVVVVVVVVARGGNDGRRVAAGGGATSKTASPAIKDEASQCSFYSVSPGQVILFCGGWMYDNNDDDVDSSTGGEEDAPPTRSRGDGAGRMVPVIVLSSTTSHLRSRLGAMGVDLRLLYAPLGGENSGGAADGRGGEIIVVT
jgi:hypothetical protein